MSEIYMMVTICNRKQMQKFVKFYKQNHVDTGNISLAMGTAASDVLDYFGLEEDEKGIHFCLVTRPTWKTVKKGLHPQANHVHSAAGSCCCMPSIPPSGICFRN